MKSHPEIAITIIMAGLLALVFLLASAVPQRDVIGIDVSHHQKSINWKTVKQWNGQPIEFVYVKATEGATYQDKKYGYNFYQAKKNGHRVGSYHYFRTSSSVVDQFKNFTSNVDKNDQMLVPLIDVEEMNDWNSKKFHVNLKLFLKMIEKHYGVKPMIYCVNSFYNRHLSYGYSDYKFMVGRYGKNSPNMKRGQWTIWQFSETGTVKGIERKVDINKLSRGYQLKDLLIKAL